MRHGKGARLHDVGESKLGVGVFRNRIALVGVAVAMLVLTGCGRKGPLEVPPSASALAAPQPAPSNQPVLGEPEHSALDGERTAELPPATPAKKGFILDWLLR